MRNVYLPTEHSEADLVLAGQLADMLESSALYVTWGPQGYVSPDVQTIVRDVPPEPEPLPSLWVEVLGTMAAFVAGIFGPRQAPRGQGTSPA